MHIWGVDENKGVNDALYLKVQAILLEDIELDGFSLFNPQMTVNEIIENESNQALEHTTIILSTQVIKLACVFTKI